VQEALHNHIT